eukprot:SAG11_NODE_717_length_7606_cov_5.968563_7_plen_170_part_00
MVELERGQLLIDDVDCATLGLDTLRRGLSIIPQEPVIFTGSLRQNLDPWDLNSDTELWTALAHVQLEAKLRRQAGSAGLEMELAEGGANLSVGQRQLVCLARSLLMKVREPRMYGLYGSFYCPMPSQQYCSPSIFGCCIMTRCVGLSPRMFFFFELCIVDRHAAPPAAP